MRGGSKAAPWQSGWAMQHCGDQGHFLKGAGHRWAVVQPWGAGRSDWYWLQLPSGSPKTALPQAVPALQLHPSLPTGAQDYSNHLRSWDGKMHWQLSSPQASSSQGSSGCRSQGLWCLLWSTVTGSFSSREEEQGQVPNYSPQALFPCLFPMVPWVASTALTSAAGAEIRVLLTHICSHDHTWRSTPGVTASLLQEGQ